MTINDYRGFYEDLKDTLNSINSPYTDLLNYCPELFKLLCNILNDKKTDWHTRLLVNSAIAYFVLPDDMIPDYEDKGKGYLDDLFLTAFVLVEIKNNVDATLLTDNWHGEENILEIVETVHDRCKILIGDAYLDVLRLVGLKKYVSLDLNEYAGDYPKRMAKLAEEKRELLGLLSFVVSKLYGAPRSREIENIKNFLKEHDDYDELERILYVAKERKNDFKKPLNESVETGQINEHDDLRAKRIERILKSKYNDI